MFRYFMLVKDLRITGHKLLHPIFVSLCGLGQAASNVWKAMRGKHNIYKLTIDEVDKKQ